MPDLLPAVACGCRRCGFVFQPRRQPLEAHDLYDEAYFADYERGTSYVDTAASRSYEAAVRVALVREHLAGGRLLEIGAAAGYFLAEARGAGFEVFGVEPSAAMARAAEEQFGVDLVAAPLEQIELPARHFDVACAWHVLEHIVEPLEAPRRVRMALRSGGYLFVEVPNFGSLCARREGSAWGPLDLEHHVAQFTPAALAALLRRADFEVIAIETVPWAEYRRLPHRLLTHAREAVALRGWPFGAHPSKHELLRGIACAR